MADRRRPENPADGMGTGRTAAGIEDLRKKYEQLRDEKTRAETNLKHQQNALEDLKAKAREAYGTDDLAELEAKLQTLKRENEEKRTAYQKALEGIEADLKAVEDKYQALDDGGRTG